MSNKRGRGKNNSNGRKLEQQLPPPPSAKPAADEFGPDWLKARLKAILLGIPGGKYILITVAALLLLSPNIAVIRSMYDDTIPRIHVFGSNPNDPFALPFTVTNASSWFDMQDVVWSCVVIEARSADGHSAVQNIELIPTDRSPRPPNTGSKPVIGSKQTDGFRCGTAGAGTAQLVARVRYKTLWFERAPVEMEFHWLRDRWFEGTLH